MFHKKKQKKIYPLLIALCAFIIGAGLFFVFQEREAPQAAEQNSAPQERTAQDENKPIINEHDGITEISLANAEKIVNKPSLEQLKEFRKRSEELVKEAAESREKKIVHLRDAELEVLPLYTFEEQKRGLIGVDFLPKDSGMLFVFQMDDAGRGFGTKSMKFPLDYIWMNSDLTVVHLTKNVPPDFPGTIMSIWPARYVIEANVGFIDANGIAVGDVATFEHIPH
ncbi:DUF192 domain-containing protein [Candidatus Uhrbacteria bacterium]|nr:DUF192 domain-containing protein [Candidatus Uhrbacteria bacterium]